MNWKFQNYSPYINHSAVYILFLAPLGLAWIFWEIRNKWLVYTHTLDRFLIIWTPFWFVSSLNLLPIWNSQNCSMFSLVFVAGSLQGHWWGFISRNYVIWPIFFLMNVFTARIKEPIFDFYFTGDISIPKTHNLFTSCDKIKVILLKIKFKYPLFVYNKKMDLCLRSIKHF